MSADEVYMQRCLDLAIKGAGLVAPNPMVGCVIVHNNKIIGEGYHQKYGGPHAEVNAINSVVNKDLLPNSTLYVSLEPCSHFGKTPPCADLILQKKIPAVVIAGLDPNPLVAGNGIARLKAAGVAVTQGILQQQADYLNRKFITFHTKHRPFITLKWAQSADGFMGLNEPKQFWFTNTESKKLMHKWRTEEQAILVGKNTVAVDDCELTARLWPGNNPLRVVIDRNLDLPADRKIFNGRSTTFIFNQIKSATEGANQFIKLDFSQNLLYQILDTLYKANIQSLTVEGGAETLRHFIDEHLWDEARVFTSPHLLQTGKPAPQLNAQLVAQTEIESDILRTYNPLIA